MRCDTLRWLTSTIMSAVLLVGCANNFRERDETLNHFLCYDAKPLSAVVYPLIELNDQFSTALEPFNLLPGQEVFCNPVEKEHGRITIPISNRDHHLLAISGGGGLPREGLVRVTNQFFPKAGQTLTVSATTSEPEFLMVPTRKHAIDPEDDREHGEPSTLDHYKCYPATSPSTPNISVGLRDQWSWNDEKPRQFAIGDVAYLCNPTEKQHGAGNTVPIRHPQDHLVCYDVDGTVSKVVTVSHQFVRPHQVSFRTNQLEWLCVPSRKEKLDGWWGS